MSKASRRHGHLKGIFLSALRRRINKQCEKCDAPSRAKGLCGRHYSQEHHLAKSKRGIKENIDAEYYLPKCICTTREVNGKKYKAIQPNCEVCAIKENPYYQQRGAVSQTPIWGR